MLFLIKYENINRVTIYSHPININYKTIERINLKLFDREFSIDHNYKSIFYIESPMDGLMSYNEQVKLFKIIADYKLNKDQKLYYICHRKSNIESDPFFKDNDNKPIFLENEYPIECYFKYFNNIDCKVIFFVTSALLSAIGRIDREKLVIIDTNMFKFNSQSKDLISQFVRFKQYQITHAKKNNK